MWLDVAGFFAIVEADPDLRLVEVFFRVDTDGSGELEMEEWLDALEMMGLAEKLQEGNAEALFRKLDDDGGGASPGR
jgi:Ca2+-binding EF-hand superfamily protein